MDSTRDKEDVKILGVIRNNLDSGIQTAWYGVAFPPLAKHALYRVYTFDLLIFIKVHVGPNKRTCTNCDDNMTK